MASREEVSLFQPSSPSGAMESVFSRDTEPSPEIERLTARLRQLLGRYETAVLVAQRLLVWERPLLSVFMASALSGVFWLFSSTYLRPLFLLSVSLLGVILLERWKHKLLPDLIGQHTEESGEECETEIMHPRLLSFPELCQYLAESWLTFQMYLQEVVLYKNQNPGKFCATVCAGCSVLAVTGHYVPGIMISYIVLLSVLLWPLVVYHELIQKMYNGLEPILMKLDYSMKGERQHRKHEKKKKQVKKEPEESSEPMAETESESEAELSSFSPMLDVKTTALALAITDSELSDEEASILESGGFSVSRATTPQLTDVSEDLDQQSVHSEPEETFSKDLAEFPSIDEFDSKDQRIQSEEEEETFGVPADTHIAEAVDGLGPETSSAEFLIQRLASPLHFVNTHFNGNAQQNSEGQPIASEGIGMTIEALSQEIVTTAISTVVQNTLSALLRSSEANEGPSISEFLPTEPEEKLHFQTQLIETEETDKTVAAEEEEADDFELLDQGELEQMDAELGFDKKHKQLEQEHPVTEASETSLSLPCELPEKES
ncbi:reticulophagy regulator 2 [Protopterus annectens]|uniref:reticulophagy regulator 2 n=1 Tax=Protopterus annectens TaxID=7888 RepID=UPI001CFBAF98|nr:reticulophagy regulator 2 [Protopterus annectens]